MKTVYQYEMKIGTIEITENGQAITNIRLMNPFDENTAGKAVSFLETSRIQEAASQLVEYFSGKRTTFTLDLEPDGTAFQKKIWKVLESIPYGETRSYKQVAAMAGNENASRAVGMANNKNPLLIVVPCHRVIGADGSLTGYACGISVKKDLLEMEKAYSLNIGDR